MSIQLKPDSRLLFLFLYFFISILLFYILHSQSVHSQNHFNLLHYNLSHASLIASLASASRQCWHRPHPPSPLPYPSPSPSSSSHAAAPPAPAPAAAPSAGAEVSFSALQLLYNHKNKARDRAVDWQLRQQVRLSKRGLAFNFYLHTGILWWLCGLLWRHQIICMRNRKKCKCKFKKC